MIQYDISVYQISNSTSINLFSVRYSTRSDIYIMSTDYQAETKTNELNDTTRNHDNKMNTSITYETIPIDDIESDNDDINNNTDITKLIHQLQLHNNNHSVSPNNTIDINSLPISIQLLINILQQYQCSNTVSSLASDYHQLTSTQQIQFEQQLQSVPPHNTTSNDCNNDTQHVLTKLHDTQNLLDNTVKHYINLKKQRNYYRINYRRVIQEKNILLNDLKHIKSKLNSVTQNTVDTQHIVNKLTRQVTAIKFERDRYKNKCDEYESIHNTTTNVLHSTNDNNSNLVSHHSTADNKTQRVRDIKSTSATNTNKLPKLNTTNKLSSTTTTTTMMTHINDSPLPPLQSTQPYIPSNRSQPIDSTQYQCIHTQPDIHASSLTSLAMHPNKSLLCTASDDHTWSLHTIDSTVSSYDTVLTINNSHSDWLSCIQFHPTGQLVGTASGDCTIKIWNLLDISNHPHTSYQPALIISEHQQPVWDIQFHGSGNYILSASNDHIIKLYDLNSQRVRNTYRGHVDTVNSISWMNCDNSIFCSGSGDKTITQWDCRAYTQQKHSTINTIYCSNAITRVLYSDCGRYLYYGDSSGIIHCIDLRNTQNTKYHELYTINTPYNNTINSLKQSHNNLYCCNDSNVISIYNQQSGEFIHQLSGHNDVVQCCVIDDSGLVVSGSNDRSYKVWSV